MIFNKIPECYVKKGTPLLKQLHMWFILRFGKRVIGVDTSQDGRKFCEVQMTFHNGKFYVVKITQS